MASPNRKGGVAEIRAMEYLSIAGYESCRTNRVAKFVGSRRYLVGADFFGAFDLMAVRRRDREDDGIFPWMMVIQVTHYSSRRKRFEKVAKALELMCDEMKPHAFTWVWCVKGDLAREPYSHFRVHAWNGEHLFSLRRRNSAIEVLKPGSEEVTYTFVADEEAVMPLLKR